MSNAALNLDVFEHYENLEKSGMAGPMAHAVKDFVLATQKAGDFATKADLREYKAERVNDLQTFEVNVDRKLDQIRHEIEQSSNKLNNKMNNMKFELVKWMMGTGIALGSLIVGLKIFG